MAKMLAGPNTESNLETFENNASWLARPQISEYERALYFAQLVLQHHSLR